MKTIVPRTVLFTVAEVEDMIESLNAAKTVRDLGGDQRRQIQDAHDDLVYARNHAEEGEVPLHASVVVSVLKCVSMTQTWLRDMVAEMSSTSENK